MHVHFRRQAEAGRAFLGEALGDAGLWGELPAETDLDALVRLVEATVTGSPFTWARTGKATRRRGCSGTWTRCWDILLRTDPNPSATTRLTRAPAAPGRP